MSPKARSVFHRGIAMMLEVFYKTFVGYDVGFLDPIHSLPDINVDVDSRFNDGEEGLLNNYLVGNFPEMDPHIL